MSRTLTLCAAILVLALLVLMPAFAEASEATVQIDQTQAAQVVPDLAPVEEPLMTPAEQPAESDLLGLEESKRINRIESCSKVGPPPICAPGCVCVIDLGRATCLCN